MPKNQSTAASRARRAAREGAKYTAALRGESTDRDVWVLVTLGAFSSGDVRDANGSLTRDDLAAIALALSGAWQYSATPCPRAVVHPAVVTPRYLVLLACLTFTHPPAGGALTPDEFDKVADAARHSMVMRGHSVTATTKRAPDSVVDRFGALAIEHGEHSPRIAEQDWWRDGLVRLTRDVEMGSDYYDFDTVVLRAGRVLTLHQRGRKGWPADTTTWVTSTDVDLMRAVPSDAMEVVDILDERPPFLDSPVESAHARLARRWQRAMALMRHVAVDDTATIGDRVMVHDHRQQVSREVWNRIVRARRDGERPDPALLLLAADIVDEVVVTGAQETAVEDGWRAEQAREQAAAMRALAVRLGGGPVPDLYERLLDADKALTQAIMMDGLVGVDARLTRRERDEAQVRFGARLVDVLAAG